LNDAMSKHLILIGSSKRAALDRAQSLPMHEAPVRAVLDDMNVHYCK